MIVIQPHTRCVNVVCFTPDGTRLASVSEDGWAKVWTAAGLHTEKPVWEVNAETDDDESTEGWSFGRGLSHAQFTPDGKLLLTSGWNRHVRAWDAKTGKPKWETRKPHGWGGVGTLVVSRDGSRVAFAGGQMWTREKVFVLDPKTQIVVKELSGHADACGALAAGPEGLASGSADKHVKFWSWESGRCYHDLALRGIVRGLVFSPDGSRFAAAGGSVVMVWEMAKPPSGRGRRRPAKLRQFRGHTDQIQCLDFSPDGLTIASSAHDGTVRTWDAAGGAEIRAFHPKVGPLHHVAFAPDGLTLAFTSEKGHVGVLDLDG
ncbi:MAG: PD40 domain-containing protein [Planctomycetes bacterium]|nr:PD40 domain-containing protein [Planctomycetota bacterium]